MGTSRNRRLDETQEVTMSSALIMVSRLRNRSLTDRSADTFRLPNLAAALATFPSRPR